MAARLAISNIASSEDATTKIPATTGARPGAPLPRVGAESPARALQENLAQAFEQRSPERWSKSATVSFILVTCGSFWVLVFSVVRWVLR